MNPSVEERLTIEDDLLDHQWSELTTWLKGRFGKDAGMESILFLIGIQATGIGYSPKLAKEKKQDLIMEGTHLALAALGLYRSVESDGDRTWIRTEMALPSLDVDEQEKLLKIGILAYFDPHLST